MKIYTYLLVILISLPTLMYGQKELDFEEGVKKGLISADLFNTSMNSIYLACPKYSSGNNSLCGCPVKTGTEYDPGLPNTLLFSIIFVPSQYNYAKKIYNDPFLLNELARIPDPSQEAMAWYESEKRGTIMLLKFDSSDHQPDTLDFFQRKMLTVMHGIRSWTFCPEEMQAGMYTLHGTYDQQKNIVIYNTACMASAAHEENITSLALVYRFFFVCAHEMGHAIDHSAGATLGGSDKEYAAAERRANLSGLILTYAFSQLFNQFMIDIKNTVDTSSFVKPKDRQYMSEAVKRWKKTSDYLAKRLSEARRIYTKGISPKRAERLNGSFNLRACLEVRKEK